MNPATVFSTTVPLSTASSASYVLESARDSSGDATAPTAHKTAIELRKRTIVSMTVGPCPYYPPPSLESSDPFRASL